MSKIHNVGFPFFVGKFLLWQFCPYMCPFHSQVMLKPFCFIDGCKHLIYRCSIPRSMVQGKKSIESLKVESLEVQLKKSKSLNFLSALRVSLALSIQISCFLRLNSNEICSREPWSFLGCQLLLTHPGRRAETPSVVCP